MNLNLLKKKSYARRLISILGFTFFLILTFIISWKFFENRAEEDVSKSKPENFPVVVVTQNKSELVFTDDLESYRQDNPNYTFWISDEKLVNRQLERTQSERRGKGIPQISVKEISEDKQLIEVEIIEDGLFKAKYETSGKEFKPLTLTISGPLFVFLPCLTTLLFGLAGFGVLKVILWYLRKRQNRRFI